MPPYVFAGYAAMLAGLSSGTLPRVQLARGYETPTGTSPMMVTRWIARIPS